MLDENGQPVTEAGPAKPVQVLGWSHGAGVRATTSARWSDEREARHLAAEREAQARAAELVTTRPPTLVGPACARPERSEIPELNLIVKADVQGSLGALTDALCKLPQDEVRVQHRAQRAPAASPSSDISLALASRRDRDRVQRPAGHERLASSPSRRASTSACTA